ATPRRHYAALAFACMPAFAKLVMIFLGQFMGVMDLAKMPPHLSSMLLYLNVLAGGFIISSLLWSSALAEVIDRRFNRASIYLLIAAGLTAFGVIHSPIPGDKMFWPWQLGDSTQIRVVVELIVSYVLMALVFFVVGVSTRAENLPIDSDEEFERIG
ncbi:MAG: hypothetical protein ABL888_12395, partial [Pirellulaceae bacterium]